MNREMRRLMDREERRQKKQGTAGAGGRATRRAAAVSRQAPPVEQRKPLPQRVRIFLHEVRQELRKVSWPTQEQMVAFTTVTVITTIILTGVVFGLDVVMKEAVLFLVNRSN